MAIWGQYSNTAHKKIESGRGHNSANDYIKFYRTDTEKFLFDNSGNFWWGNSLASTGKARGKKGKYILRY